MPEFDALWNFDDPALSERRFRESIAALEPGSIDRLETETQLARAIGLQMKFDDAHRVLDGVESAASEHETPHPRLAVRIALERGRVHNSSGKRELALPLFATAYETAVAAGEDALAVDAAHMIAIAESPERAMVWNERALALSQRSADPRARRWRASLLNNRGWTRHGEGAYEAALELFEQALDARREQGSAGAIRVARWCVARCLRSLNRIEEALGLQRSLARELEGSSASDGFVDEEIAECLLALGRGEEAKRHFARAAQLLGEDPWFVAEEAPRLARLRSLSAAS